MSAVETEKIGRVNGLNVDALYGVIDEVNKDPAKGIVEFRIKTAWKGQTRSETSVVSYKLGGREIRRHFAINADEPLELLGENTDPNLKSCSWRRLMPVLPSVMSPARR